MDPAEDPKTLKKENETLRRRLKLAEDLIVIYRELPFARAASEKQSSEEGDKTPSKGLGEKRGRARRAARRKASPSSPRPQTSSEMAPGAETDPAR